MQGVEIVKQTQTKIQQLLPRSLWTTLDFLYQRWGTIELREGGISGSELVQLGLLPKNYHLDDGDDGDVGYFIDGRKGKSTVKYMLKVLRLFNI